MRPGILLPVRAGFAPHPHQSSRSEMVTTFATPQDFLRFLQTDEASPVARSAPDPAVLADVMRRAAERDEEAELGGIGTTDATPSDDPPSLIGRVLQGDPSGIPDAVHRLNLLTDPLVAELLETVPDDVRRRITAHVAVGSLASGEMNAIYRSAEGHHAILVDEGLLVLLHKYFKINTAIVHPEQVAYCDRKPARELTPDDLYGYLQEVVASYKIRGAPIGPVLVLTGDAQRTAGNLLAVAELFMLCHELGHYLNGDFDEGRVQFTPLRHSPSVEVWTGSAEHEVELRADRTAFELLARIAERKHQLPQSYALYGVMLLFNLLAVLEGGRASAPHPPALDRTVSLALQFFSRKTAIDIARWYEDPSGPFPAFG